jgi:hypothetical protein
MDLGQNQNATFACCRVRCGAIAGEKGKGHHCSRACPAHRAVGSFLEGTGCASPGSAESLSIYESPRGFQISIHGTIAAEW